MSRIADRGFDRVLCNITLTMVHHSIEILTIECQTSQLRKYFPNIDEEVRKADGQ